LVRRLRRHGWSGLRSAGERFEFGENGARRIDEPLRRSGKVFFLKREDRLKEGGTSETRDNAAVKTSGSATIRHGDPIQQIDDGLLVRLPVLALTPIVGVPSDASF
jgi:hypothetical protein